MPRICRDTADVAHARSATLVVYPKTESASNYVANVFDLDLDGQTPRFLLTVKHASASSALTHFALAVDGYLPVVELGDRPPPVHSTTGRYSILGPLLLLTLGRSLLFWGKL